MTTPTSADDAEQRRQQLTLEIQGIQAQLGDRQRADEQGRRLNSQEYWAWKRRAAHALNQKLDELRSIKAMIQDRRASAVTPLVPAGDLQEALVHLAELYAIVTDPVRAAPALEPQALVRVSAAGVALRRLQAQVAASVVF